MKLSVDNDPRNCSGETLSERPQVSSPVGVWYRKDDTLRFVGIESEAFTMATERMCRACFRTGQPD